MQKKYWLLILFFFSSLFTYDLVCQSKSVINFCPPVYILEMDANALSLTPPQNAFEIKIGIEAKRKILEGIIGYKFGLNENLSIVPELSFICGVLPSVSLRLQHNPDENLALFTQGGVGYLLLIGKNVFVGVGLEYRVFRKLKLQTEVRVVIIESNNHTKSKSISGYDILNHKPLVVSVGIVF